MKRLTVPELFFRTILTTYQLLQDQGIIKFDEEKEEKYLNVLQAIKSKKMGQIRVLILDRVADELDKKDDQQ
jgi:hypothetical protein